MHSSTESLLRLLRSYCAPGTGQRMSLPWRGACSSQGADDRRETGELAQLEGGEYCGEKRKMIAGQWGGRARQTLCQNFIQRKPKLPWAWRVGCDFGRLPEKSKKMTSYIFTWEQRGWRELGEAIHLRNQHSYAGTQPPGLCPVGHGATSRC